MQCPKNNDNKKITPEIGIVKVKPKTNNNNIIININKANQKSK